MDPTSPTNARRLTEPDGAFLLQHADTLRALPTPEERQAAIRQLLGEPFDQHLKDQAAIKPAAPAPLAPGAIFERTAPDGTGERVVIERLNPGDDAQQDDRLFIRRVAFLKDGTWTPSEIERPRHMAAREFRKRFPDAVAAGPVGAAPGRDETTAAPASDTSFGPHATMEETAARARALAAQKAQAKAARRAVKPEQDDLVTAIAKLGGISHAEAKSQGIDPAAFKQQGFGGVFTRDGDSFDGLAERLDQYGYPVRNAEGRYDSSVLLDLVQAALKGERVISNRGADAEGARLDAERVAQEAAAAAPAIRAAWNAMKAPQRQAWAKRAKLPGGTHRRPGEALRAHEVERLHTAPEQPPVGAAPRPRPVAATPAPQTGEETGPFGPIARQFHHDAQGAIAWLKERQTGEAVAALHHPDVGDIDLVWGEEGTARSDGSGLAKLVKWHPEVLGDLQGFISSLTVKQRDKKRIQLWDGADKRAVIKLTFDERRKLWLLTAYEKEGTGRATSPDTGALDGEGDTARLSSSSDSSVAGVGSAPSGISASAGRGDETLAHRQAQTDQGEDFSLTQETPADLARMEQERRAADQAPRAAKAKEAADAQQGDFNLTGSDRTADELAARGQQSLFDDDVPFSRDPIVSPESQLAPHEHPAGLSLAEAQAIADDFGARLLGASVEKVKVQVVQTQAEAFGADSRQRIGRIKGAYDPDTNRIILVAEHLRDRADAQTVLRHEAIGHYGLDLLTPADKQTFLEMVDAAADTTRYLRRLKAQEQKRAKPGTDRLVIAEEMFAKLAEQRRSDLGTAWDRLLLWLHGKLKALGLVTGRPNLTVMRVLAADLARAIRAGQGRQNGTGQAPVRYSGLLTDARLAGLVKQYAKADGAPSAAELAEAVRQYRAVEDRYADVLRAHDEQGQALPAPNGKPSKLNREQWVLVRTDNFKRWFGDWDALARQREHRALIDRALADTAWQQRTLIAEGYDADPSGKLSDAFGFPVARTYLTPDDIRKTNKRHGAGNERRTDQVGLTQDDYVKALEVLRDPETFKNTTSNNGKPSAEFGRMFSDGTYVVAEVEIAEPGGVSIKSAWKKVPGRNHEGAQPFPIRTSRTAAGVGSSISSATLLVNPDTVSQVVDANGEPLVAYHGTHRDFSEFDPSAPEANPHDFNALGMSFTDAQRIANNYSDAYYDYDAGELRHGGRVLPVFVRLAAPFETNYDDLASKSSRAIKGLRSKAEAQQNDGFKIGRYNGQDGYDYLIWDSRQVKSAIGNAGTYGPSKDMRFAFAGERAATADTHALGRAQEWLADGMTADDVRRKTGWFRGADGKWRFEINDSGAMLRTKVGGAFESKPAGMEAYAPLGAVLSHPRLFDAYPSLRLMQTDIIINPDGKAKGQYGEGAITVDARSEEEALSILLHEIQHGIQRVEGFATGTNLQAVREDLQQTAPELLASYTRTGETHKLLADRYRRSAGEAEARNVQARQHLSTIERENTPPGSTQDVPGDDVIVRFNGREMHSAPRPENAGQPADSVREDVIQRATPKRSAASMDQAKTAAAKFVGKPLENAQTRLVAVVSNNNLGKMTSHKAVVKSTSGRDHALAVANADQLFRNAILDSSHPDVRGEPTIAAMHRYVAPMISEDGSVLAVKMTVKETTGPREPNPLYTIETLDVEKPTLMAPSLKGIERGIGVSDVATSPTGGLSPRVHHALQEVKDALANQDAGVRFSLDTTTADLDAAAPGRWQRTKDFITSRSAKLLPAALGTVTLHQLAEIANPQLPGILRYDDLRGQMETYRNDMMEEAGTFATEVFSSWVYGGKGRPLFQYLKPKVTAEARALFDTIHQATLANEDPSEGHKPLSFVQALGPGWPDERIEVSEASLADLRAKQQRWFKDKEDRARVPYVMAAIARIEQLMPKERARQKERPALEKAWNALSKGRFYGNQGQGWQTKEDALRAQQEIDRTETKPTMVKQSADGRWFVQAYGAQEIYKDVRDLYKKRDKERFDAYLERVQNSGVLQDDNSAAAEIARMRMEYEASVTRNGEVKVEPYFPLYRQGDYWASGKLYVDKAPEAAVFYQDDAAKTPFETEKAAWAAAKKRPELERYNLRAVKLEGEKGWTLRELGTAYYDRFNSPHEARQARAAMTREGYADIKGGMVDKKSQPIEGVSEGFVADAIDKLKATGDEKAADLLHQLYLEQLQEMSQRIHFIHRKGVAGYEDNALKAFGHTMFHMAHQIAKTRWEPRLAEQIRVIEENKKERTDQGEITDTADAYLGELKKRHDWVMNPENAPWTSTTAALGFFWYLGVSPGAALVNLSQTPLIAYPALAARFDDWGGARKAMLGALSDVRKGMGMDNLKGALTGRPHPVMPANLSGEERAAIEQWTLLGVRDVTQAHNLAGIGDSDRWNNSPGVTRVMSILSAGFHLGEIVNRDVTLLGAYRLARLKGQSHAQAVETAAELTVLSHFDYANANRARFMQGDAAKALLMFRSYSQGVLYLLGRSVWQATKGESAAVKREARQRLVGVLGMTFMAAGTAGLPLMGAAFMVMNLVAAAFGDDDEPWDAEVEFRSWLSANLPGFLAKTVDRGVVNAATGLDLSGRVGLDSLLFRAPNRDENGAKTHDYIVEQILGPLGGIGAAPFKAYDDLVEGHPHRALEAMSPKFLKDILKAERYTREGVLNRRGDPVMGPDEQLNAWELVWQGLGMSPDKVGAAFDTANMLKLYEGRIVRRRTELQTAFALAAKDGDREAEARLAPKIQAWNLKHQQDPKLLITPRTVRNSVKAGERHTQRAQSGVELRPGTERLRERLGAPG
ncbi:PLxRFG domain-containing protein [uncultured Thiodictyon sp.]|uniref:PLxRFG domain-containing protein n=1 Tax=uncultured Thiodictyon sp. TaxID=1846217 RepID=UPI0025D425C7|nr:PLxRFG domain-containing protein [uncultured Thiodictyon sp.]